MADSSQSSAWEGGTMEANPLRAAVARSELQIGTWINLIRNPAILTLLQAAGLDFARIDMEHSHRRSRPWLIPAILRVDPCPGAVSDGIDALRVANEEVPSILAGGDDCLVAVPNTLAELIAAQIVPDVLHRVEVWRVGR
jgi:hypothetical protein